MKKDTNGRFSAKNICNVLVAGGFITHEQASNALNLFESAKKKLEKSKAEKEAASPSGIRIDNPITAIDVLTSLKLQRADAVSKDLEEESIYQLLAEAWNLEYKKIDPLKLDLNLVTTTIPRSFAMKHLVLPIDISEGCLTIATSNPFNIEVMDDITRVTQMNLKTVVSSKTDIIKLINEFFGFKRSIAAAEIQFDQPTVDLGNLEQYVRLKSAEELPSNDQHIVNAVNHLLVYAFEQRASDIHIEPKRDITLVRMRIDGMLHNVYKLPKKVHNAIISRIKALSRLDMAEKRRPQDGRIKTDKGGVEVEIRISMIPVAFGEKVVMRLMDPEILFQDLDKLGYTASDLTRYNDFINRPHGIVLVCGPTGSGKSTTLYSTLKQLSTPEINITTVEDPIEMINQEFNQIAVQQAVGITFSKILRNILRQDPDIIMIGEMRDLETAENAVQAAMTGHLVLSTLHTNDAPSSIVRLLDLGVPHFLIQATLVGVMSQRLVRTICKNCIETFTMDASELRRMGIETGDMGPVKLNRGKGCIKCRGTGYRGRSGIFEVLPFTESIKKIVTPQTDVEALRTKAREEGMVTLRENAVMKLVEGKTTYEEVLRVTWGHY